MACIKNILLNISLASVLLLRIFKSLIKTPTWPLSLTPWGSAPLASTSTAKKMTFYIADVKRFRIFQKLSRKAFSSFYNNAARHGTSNVQKLLIKTNSFVVILTNFRNFRTLEKDFLFTPGQSSEDALIRAAKITKNKQSLIKIFPNLF